MNNSSTVKIQIRKFEQDPVVEGAATLFRMY